MDKKELDEAPSPLWQMFFVFAEGPIGDLFVKPPQGHKNPCPPSLAMGIPSHLIEPKSETPFGINGEGKGRGRICPFPQLILNQSSGWPI